MSGWITVEAERVLYADRGRDVILCDREMPGPVTLVIKISDEICNMREPGQSPQFGRMMQDLLRAQEAWQYGETEKAERILKMVGSIAIAEAQERGPSDPVPEPASLTTGHETK